MLARVRSGAVTGIDAVAVEVELDMSLGLPYFNVVGLPEGAVKESKVRVVSALKNTGFDLPQKRITVNLAPADIRKEGAAFELPIAIGVLVAARLLDDEPVADWLFAGELSLDGAVKPIRGVLPLAVLARDLGLKGVMVPAGNADEASLVDRIDVLAVGHLRDVVDHLTGAQPLQPFLRASAAPTPSDTVTPRLSLDMADVRGQEDVKAALEAAAAGGHNLLMCGAPGSGKTMLARRLPGILPSMSFAEALEVTKIYSVLGMLPEDRALLTDRPFRSPHHTISDAGLVGGGPLGRPGELSMAHNGVLFLDELPEFRKNVLEVLRQPLEEGVIHIARASHHLVYPCRVMMVAAMNPCPCGWFNVQERRCLCKDVKVQEYHQRVSGPLMDRIDLTIEVRPVAQEPLLNLSQTGKPSAYYRARVEAARDRQRHRFGGTAVTCNAQMGPQEMRAHCRLDAAADKRLRESVKNHGLSARAHDRIIKVARTLADLDGSERIRDAHLHLATQFRMVDRRGWIRAGLEGQSSVSRWSKGKTPSATAQ